MPPVIQVENLSKLYRLGEVSTGTISHDLNRWWHKVRGKEDPYLKVGQVNDRTKTRKKAENGKAAGANAENGKAETLKKESDISAFQDLSVSDFSSDYVYALKDINFSVNQGEVLGIIGRNGAGKSTLLKILSRVTAPTSGKINVKGRIASLLEVGTGFHPELTGRENIYLNGAILGMRKHEISRKLDEIVDFSGCAAYLDTPVKRYSSGMYVRLAFAVAAHLDPEILVVDEVLAVGDAEFQRKCLGKMQNSANQDGRTVLFVSHNMGAIRSICTSALLVECGTIQLQGSVEEVVKLYDGTGRKLKQSSYSNNKSLKESNKPQVLGAACLNNLGETIESVDFDIPLSIEFDIVLPYSNSNIELTFRILNNLGHAVFTSNVSDTYGRSFPADRIGAIKLRAVLPSHFLLPGFYTVNVALHEPNFVMYEHIERALCFTVLDTGTAGSKYGAKAVELGSVFAAVEWKV